MKRYNLMILEKGKTRYFFERQFFSRSAAVLEGERLMRDPILSPIFVSFKVVPCYRRRFYIYDR